jgi:hypothetical protein
VLSPYVPSKPPPFSKAPKFRPHPVDGLRVLAAPATGLAALEQFLDARAAVPEPAWILIQGSSGSGQTTLAYHVLNHYSERRGFKEFLVPSVAGQLDHDTELTLLRWVVALELQMVDHKILSPELGVAFAGFRQSPVGQRLTELPILLLKVRQHLENLGQTGLGVLLDQVRNPDILGHLLQAFDTLPAVIVLTTAPITYKPEVWQPHVDVFCNDPRARVVPLGTLTDADLFDLAQARWPGPAPCPFARPNVDAVFHQVAHGERPTVQRGLRILDFLHKFLAQKPAPFDAGDLAEAYELYRDIRNST